MYISICARNVKLASNQISLAGVKKKNEILKNIESQLLKNEEIILEKNKIDVCLAEKNGLSESLIDRLSLSRVRIEQIANSIEKVINLEDPVGEIIFGRTCENGLRIEKIRVPFGVVGIIYEARPNVTVDSAVLCLKSGNGVFLRGGREAFNTNFELVKTMKEAIKKSGFSENLIGFVEDVSRQGALEMMRLKGVLDVLIPRGGKGLIKSVLENSAVPVIETGTGNCHVYVDEFANIDMAIEITVNAKTSRPSVCNSAESLVVHEAVAEKFLKALKEKFDELNVEMVGCEKTLKILPNVKPATEEDFYTEYCSLKMSVKIVENLNEAIDHINKYSSGHSEAIVTENYSASESFLKLVDSSAVYCNASTRFTDGEEFGFGAEIGISTQKLHARGPMGLKCLTTEKFIIRGSGQTR